MCGGREHPPYNTKRTPRLPGNGQRRTVSAGGMYAAPTHRPNAVAAQKRDHKATGFGLCTRYRVFVGEAYMPPGRGVRRAGFAG